ncbi:MAG TPA: M48 family metallopeptidase, partial [Accumulibacter sp.]|nr:M48 family metallopeptidase [Accumulibacter sp.]
RWGSCSAQGVIRLNWRLLHLPLPLIDYVLIHELAHLLEMNHGPRFWAIVATACPDYQALRRQLRQQSASGPLWQGEQA